MDKLLKLSTLLSGVYMSCRNVVPISTLSPNSILMDEPTPVHDDDKMRVLSELRMVQSILRYTYLPCKGFNIHKDEIIEYRQNGNGKYLVTVEEKEINETGSCSLDSFRLDYVIDLVHEVEHKYDFKPSYLNPGTVKQGKMYEHKKKGGTYTIISVGIHEQSYLPIVHYQSASSSIIWSRPMHDFIAKFKEISAV